MPDLPSLTPEEIRNHAVSRISELDRDIASLQRQRNEWQTLAGEGAKSTQPRRVSQRRQSTSGPSLREVVEASMQADPKTTAGKILAEHPQLNRNSVNSTLSKLRAAARSATRTKEAPARTRKRASRATKAK